LKHRDKNFAFSLTIWDRLAGTLYMPDESEKDTLVLGLGDGEERDFQSVWQLYATPFRNLLSRVPGRKAAAPPPPLDGVPAE
jgi:sterol desaturase/sphingolipid hydroxylase (fatty acid hydroxylase superfamily)